MHIMPTNSSMIVVAKEENPDILTDGKTERSAIACVGQAISINFFSPDIVRAFMSTCLHASAHPSHIHE